MRPSALLTLIVIAACASGTGPLVTSTSAGAVLGTDIRTRQVEGQDVSTIDAAINPVWIVVAAAYDSIGIPITVIDSKQHTFGNQGFTLRGRLGKVPLSRYIVCGGAGTGFGANADSYEVYLAVLTRLRATDTTHTELITTVDAAARPASLSQPFSKCGSKGEIEARISALVQALVTRKQEMPRPR
jgi:hypothetical protein